RDVGDAAAHLLEELELALVGVVQRLPRVLVLVQGLVSLGSEDQGHALKKAGHVVSVVLPGPRSGAGAPRTRWRLRGVAPPRDGGDAAAHLLEERELALVGVVRRLPRVLVLVQGLVSLGSEDQGHALKKAGHVVSVVLPGPRSGAGAPRTRWRLRGVAPPRDR